MRGLAALVLVSLVACSASAQDGEKPRGSAMLICYPNAPGTSRQAQPIMDQFGQYMSQQLGEPVRPEYFSKLERATQWLQTRRPRFGILSLSMFLRWRQENGLTVVAFSERQGVVAQRFHLLIGKDSPLKALEDLQTLGRDAHIWSSLLDETQFANRVVFASRLDLGDPGVVKVASTTQPLRALRRLKKGSPFQDKPVDAVLVDAVTWSGLQKLPTFKGLLRVLYSSPALPTPPVVAFRGVEPARSEKLGAVLSSMGDDENDDEGRRLLRTLQVTGFRLAQPDAMAKAIAAYEGKH
jgi:ABC-type phosphate/phosphonate transport system substrate-binding protein